MKCFATYLLGLVHLSGAASADQPIVADAVASYEARSSELCPEEHAGHAKVAPETWYYGPEGSEPVQHDWPINKAEQQIGAFGTVMTLVSRRLIAIVDVYGDKNRAAGVFDTQQFQMAYRQTQTGAALAKCLIPDTATISKVPAGAPRDSMIQSLAKLECQSWFEIVDRGLALDNTRSDLAVATNQVLAETFGQCRE